MRFSSLLPVVLAEGILSSSMTTCVVPSNYESSNGTASDADAIAKAFAECSENAIIEFSEGVNYNVFEPVVAKNLSNVVISLKGNWNLPQNISQVQSVVEANGGTLYWFTFKGTNIQFVGTPNVSRCKWSFSRDRTDDWQDHDWLDQILRTSMVGRQPSGFLRT